MSSLTNRSHSTRSWLLAAALAGCSGGAGPPSTHTIAGTIAGGAGATVALGGAATATATADAGGRFAFGGLRDGDYSVTPERAGFRITPPSRAVQLAGADAPGLDFTAQALHQVTGAVTGSVVAGIAVTLEDATGAATTVSTGGDGTFSIPGAVDGAYTVTPSRLGLAVTPYRRRVNVAGADVSGLAFVTSASAVPFAVVGQVTYAGAKTGRILIGCDDLYRGTSVRAPGAYRIRGFADGGACRPTAWMDTVGQGVRHSIDPVGTGVQGVIQGDHAAVDIALADPPEVAPVQPGSPLVVPLDGALLVAWDPGPAEPERATAYALSWGTDAAASNGGRRVLPANGQGMAFLGGLAGGSSYYVKLAERVGRAESAASGATGPVKVGPAGGGAAVTGTVTFPGVARGPLYVLVGRRGPIAAAVHGVRIAHPVSPQAFVITGVPDGPSALFAVLDQDDDGLVASGDPSNVRWYLQDLLGIRFKGGFTVAGDTHQDLVLPDRRANLHMFTTGASVPGFTGYAGAGYLFGEEGEPVDVVQVGGPGADGPIDLLRQPGYQSGFLTSFYATSWQLSAPAPGSAYAYAVGYSDGGTEDLVGVLDTFIGFPAALAADPSAPNSATAPLFTWAAPATVPARTWGYWMSLDYLWRYPPLDQVLPPAQTSIVYDADGLAGALGPGQAYTWRVGIQDDHGDGAYTEASYTP